MECKCIGLILCKFVCCLPFVVKQLQTETFAGVKKTVNRSELQDYNKTIKNGNRFRFDPCRTQDILR